MKHESLARRLCLSALAVALVFALAEGVLSWGYALIKAYQRVSERPQPEARIAQHDAELGWTNVPGKLTRDLYGPGRSFTSNAQGFRALEEYTPRVPPGRCRAVFAGDSFTMGFGVDDRDTYPAQLERLDARVQSVNLGMGAYGADQAFLRYRRDAAPLAHDVVVLAFIAHDLRRMASSFYMAPKPQLALQNGALVVDNSPVPESDASEDAREALTAFLQHLDLGKALARATAALRPPPSAADAEREAAFEVPMAEVAAAMFGELANLARDRGADLLVVYLPTRAELALSEQPARDWAQQVAVKRGLRFVDATPAFRGRELAPLFGLDNHYSEAGNALVAGALLPSIRELCGLGGALGVRPQLTPENSGSRAVRTR